MSSAWWASSESSSRKASDGYTLKSVTESIANQSTVTSLSSLSELSNLASLLVTLIWTPTTSLSSILQYWNTALDPHASLRAYIHTLLEATRVSSSVVILALKYLHRLRSRTLRRPSASVNPSLSTPTVAFLLCLVFSNKFADDERFTNTAWASVGGLSLKDLNAAERDALGLMGYNLCVSEGEYAEWLDFLVKVVADSERIVGERDALASVIRSNGNKRRSVEYPSLTLTPSTPTYNELAKKKRVSYPLHLQSLPTPSASLRTPPATIRARSFASLPASPCPIHQQQQQQYKQQQQYISQRVTPLLASHISPPPHTLLPSHLPTPVTPFSIPQQQVHMYTQQQQYPQQQQLARPQQYQPASIVLPTQSVVFAPYEDLSLGFWGGRIGVVGC
ncbi:hypothetical protein HDV00_000437 [Rhizophlyctis rosea]|nr:hypothetical protein HDV00_000437 [Rhizophlyctis rosea]